jgi:hypothetical protein
MCFLLILTIGNIAMCFDVYKFLVIDYLFECHSAKKLIQSVLEILTDKYGKIIILMSILIAFEVF